MSKSVKQSANSTPKASTESAASVEMADQLSNAEMQALINGPVGNIFQKIVRQSSEDITQLSFDQSMLKEYIKNDLGFARGEMFRGTKITGAAKGLMEELDKDKDGVVNWADFTGITDQLSEALLPDSIAALSEQELAQAAAEQFDAVAGSQDGELTLAEMQAQTLEALPEETDHKKLVAQLAARLAIDAMDQNQGSLSVDDRTLSRTEWIEAAVSLIKGRE